MAANNHQALENQRYGDIQYNRGHTYWDVLHAGTSGQVLQTQGINKPPKWAIAKLCYDAVVDPAGTGTHTTIQSAINAVKSTADARILVFGGTYAENLTPPSGGSATHINLEACPPEWGHQYTGTATPTIGVTLAPASGIVFDQSGSDTIQFNFTGFKFEGVNGQHVVLGTAGMLLFLSDCWLHSNSSTNACIHTTGAGSGGGRVDMLRCFMQASAINTVCIDGSTSATPPIFYARESTFSGYVNVDAGVGGIFLAQDCSLTANGASYILDGAYNLQVQGCDFHAEVSTSTQCIRTTKQSGVASYFVIEGCRLYNRANLTVTAITLASNGGTHYGLINDNYFASESGGLKWNVGVSIGANTSPIIFANQWTDTTTPVSGTPQAIASGESAVTAVALHNILSATHTDAVTASVIAGDLLYGNSTPKWDRLPKGTNGQVLTMTAGAPAWGATPISAVFYIPFGSQAGIGEAYTH